MKAQLQELMMQQSFYPKKHQLVDIAADCKNVSPDELLAQHSEYQALAVKMVCQSDRRTVSLHACILFALVQLPCHALLHAPTFVMTLALCMMLQLQGFHLKIHPG